MRAGEHVRARKQGAKGGGAIDATSASAEAWQSGPYRVDIAISALKNRHSIHYLVLSSYPRSKTR